MTSEGAARVESLTRIVTVCFMSPHSRPRVRARGSSSFRKEYLGFECRWIETNN